MIILQDIKVNLSGKTILDFAGKNIEISNGSKLAVLGENGAGKTTLINTVLGEYKLSRGAIEKDFQGSDVGIVFQDNSYSDLIKVKEFVALIFPHWRRDSVDAFLNKYQLSGLENSLIKDLSAGELQRFTLGLVLSQQKSVYFFDEITSGLDAYKRSQLLKIMTEETRDATVINISHYFEEINNWATDILILRRGRLAFYGTKSQLFADFPHIGALKVNGMDAFPVDESIQHADTGDGTVYYLKDAEDKAKLTEQCHQDKVEFSYLEPSIYTCYLMANQAESIVA